MSSQRQTGRAESAVFHPDEIIVAVPHLEQVTAVLDLAGVRPPEAERSPALDLARVTLPDVDAAAAALRRHLPKHRVPAPAGSADGPPIDQVLGWLRAYFAAKQGGWTPTIGKNRFVGAVSGGGGAISHGGGGAPTPVVGNLAPRAAGPGRGVRVGILDTALAPQPWLDGAWLAGYDDLLPKNGEYAEAAGHATFVASLVLSQAPGATVVVRKVLDRDEHDEYTADSWTVANAIVELGRSGIDVLNLSLVSYTEDGQPPLLLSTAISRLDRDVVVVAAAGNHGDLRRRKPPVPGNVSKPTYPAALDGVTAVGAASRNGNAASFTPKDKFWIDYLAPGVDLLGVYLDGKVALDGDLSEKFCGLARWSGTSFAAALFSGAVAARTLPGRVTARQALHDIAGAAGPSRHVSLPRKYTPPFVRLDRPRLVRG
jgi:membrane-anchored mycosin MYCP